MFLREEQYSNDRIHQELEEYVSNIKQNQAQENIRLCKENIRKGNYKKTYKSIYRFLKEKNQPIFYYMKLHRLNIYIIFKIIEKYLFDPNQNPNDPNPIFKLQKWHFDHLSSEILNFQTYLLRIVQLEQLKNDLPPKKKEKFEQKILTYDALLLNPENLQTIFKNGMNDIPTFTLKALLYQYIYYKHTQQNGFALRVLSEMIVFVEYYQSVKDQNDTMRRMMAKILIIYGNFFFESQNFLVAKEQYYKALDYQQIVYNNILNWFKIQKTEDITKLIQFKVEKIIEELIEIIALLANTYEQLRDFDRVLECWNLATWLINQLQLYEGYDIFQTVIAQQHEKAINSYKAYQEQTADINKVLRFIYVDERMKIYLQEIKKEQESNTFSELQNLLYMKGQYSQLNQEQFIIVKSDDRFKQKQKQILNYTINNNKMNKYKNKLLKNHRRESSLNQLQSSVLPTKNQSMNSSIQEKESNQIDHPKLFKKENSSIQELNSPQFLKKQDSQTHTQPESPNKQQQIKNIQILSQNSSIQEFNQVNPQTSNPKNSQPPESQNKKQIFHTKNLSLNSTSIQEYNKVNPSILIAKTLQRPESAQYKQQIIHSSYFNIDSRPATASSQNYKVHQQSFLSSVMNLNTTPNITINNTQSPLAHDIVLGKYFLQLKKKKMSMDLQINLPNHVEDEQKIKPIRSRHLNMQYICDIENKIQTSDNIEGKKEALQSQKKLKNLIFDHKLDLYINNKLEKKINQKKQMTEYFDVRNKSDSYQNYNQSMKTLQLCMQYNIEEKQQLYKKVKNVKICNAPSKTFLKNFFTLADSTKSSSGLKMHKLCKTEKDKKAFISSCFQKMKK